MAVDLRNLALTYPAGKGHAKKWDYVTTDDALTVLADDYFANATDHIGLGDDIRIKIVDSVNASLRSEWTMTVDVTVSEK